MARKKTYDEVKKEFEDEGYTLLSKEYVNSKTKMKIACPKGHEYESIYGCFHAGCRCPDCATINRGNKLRSSYDDIKKIFEEKGYTLLSKEYVNWDIPVSAMCPNGHKYKSYVGNFKRGHGCQKCSTKKHNGKTQRKKLSEIIVFLEKNDYKYLSGKYKNNTSKIKLLCPDGHEFHISWGEFQQGRRCPICNEPKGESRVRNFLNKNKIKFKKQKKFSGCMDIRPLPFDFYLSEYNVAIEYNGKQHYEKIDFFGGEEGFKGRKRRDRIKRNFCKDNEIKLIEIKYTQFDNIEKILKKELGI